MRRGSWPGHASEKAGSTRTWASQNGTSERHPSHEVGQPSKPRDRTHAKKESGPLAHLVPDSGALRLGWFEAATDQRLVDRLGVLSRVDFGGVDVHYLFRWRLEQLRLLSMPSIPLRIRPLQ